MKMQSDISEQTYPVLDRMIYKINEYTPNSDIEIYSNKDYNPPVLAGETDNRDELNKTFQKDLERLVLLFNAGRIKRIAHLDSELIYELKKERSYYAKDKINSHQEAIFNDWYNKTVIEQLEEYFILLNNRLESIFSIYFTDVEKNKLNLRGLFKNWYENFQSLDSDDIPNDPFVFIDEFVKQSFLDAEKKATNGTGEFKSLIRCAAFCELIYYERAYIINTKTPLKTMIAFAKSRYKMNISTAIAPAKNKERQEHQQKVKSGLPPLKNCLP
jgi:hypothetical protein